MIELFKTIDDDHTGRISIAELGRALFPEEEWQDRPSSEQNQKSLQEILDGVFVPLDVMVNRVSDALALVSHGIQSPAYNNLE